jgi:hypothetical protein
MRKTSIITIVLAFVAVGLFSVPSTPSKSEAAPVVTTITEAPTTTTSTTEAPTTTTTSTTAVPVQTSSTVLTRPAPKTTTTTAKPRPRLTTTTTTSAPTTTTTAPEPTTTIPTSPRDTSGPGDNPWPITSNPSGDPNSYYIMTGTARWNPCAPIHYVTALSESKDPAGDLETIKRSFAVISQAMGGVEFIYDGPAVAGDAFGNWRPTYYPELYGTRFSPILVAIGSGLGYSVYGTSKPQLKDGVIVSGEILLNSTYGAMPNVTMHEIGHVMGLGHVDDYSQLMGEHSRAYFLGAGDLTGFRIQGKESGCVVPPELG